LQNSKQIVDILFNIFATTRRICVTLLIIYICVQIDYQLSVVVNYTYMCVIYKLCDILCKTVAWHGRRKAWTGDFQFDRGSERINNV